MFNKQIKISKGTAIIENQNILIKKKSFLFQFVFVLFEII